MKNRGILRGRMFFGSLLLAAAAVAWGTALGMSPHGESAVAGTEHVRTTIVALLTKAAILTLVLSGLSTWLLFPSRRPKAPLRDYAVMGLIGLLVLSSLYQLLWLRVAI